MGYTKTFEMKILRTKHRIDFDTRTTAAELREVLSKVPSSAKVDGVSENGEGGYYLEFHDETPVE